MHGCHLWTGFCLHSYLVGEVMWLSQAQFGKVQIVSKAQNSDSQPDQQQTRLPEGTCWRKWACSPAREWLPLEQEQGSSLPSMLTSIPVSATCPCSSVSQQKQYSRLTPKLSLPLRPAEMVSMRDTGTWKARQSFKKKSKVHLHDEPKPTVGVYSKPRSPQNL